ncbi:MAG: aminoacyl-tRNA hydrolase [Candidatus Portiera sp.]|nr:aminoacyl-tRNA hydrolase [Portiera sp.]
MNMLITGIIWVFFLDNLCEQDGIVLTNKTTKNVKEGMELGVWRDKVSIMKPLTFMNNSGSVVAAYAKYHNISPNETLVVHDELDFDCGRAKFKFSGSEGGNNGLKSISSHFGSRDYWRLRIGIGRPPSREDTVNYVLKSPNPAQRKQYQELIPVILRAITNFIWEDKSLAVKSLHTELG